MAFAPRPPTDLSDLLHLLAGRLGDRTAVIGERDRLRFADLDRAADDWAVAFASAGLGPGAHIGLLAGNGPTWLAVAFGVWRSGATLVPVSTFATARELGEVLDHGDIAALVVQARLRSHDYLESLRALSRPAGRPEVIVLGAAAPARRAGRAVPLVADPDSTACLLYTSGTAGRAKGVMLSHRAILSTVLPTAERSGLDETDCLLSTLPLFWVAGLVIRALPTLAAGCALSLVETFRPEAVLAALRRDRHTALHFRPPQVGQILSHPDFDPVLLADVTKGNGRLAWFHPHLDADRTRFITGYGMTEMSGYVTALDWRDPAEVRQAQIGTPLPGVRMRIVDAEGGEVSRGEVGEIQVRGPGMFSGYHRQPAQTDRDRDGYFRTGDLGRIDAGGVFHFVGRSKDLVRVKGINVSPLEVESVLASHPGVESVYVVGLPPQALEQRLVALVVEGTEARVREVELRAFARHNLSHYKCPEHYVFLSRAEVPLGATSKPQRAALAELAARRLGMQVATR